MYRHHAELVLPAFEVLYYLLIAALIYLLLRIAVRVLRGGINKFKALYGCEEQLS
jgi:hypothetical protein